MTKTDLTPEQIDFLLNYTPKDRLFTSSHEIVLIGVKFNLTELTDMELLLLRNNVVFFYHDKLKEETLFDANGRYKGRTEKYDIYMRSMQSVTAVIDRVIHSNIL